MASADDDYDDIFGEGQADEEEGLWEQDEAERLRESKASDPLSAAEPGQLEKLAEWGLSYESRPDSRLEALISFLDAVCRPDGKHWTNERVVVFTEYADTVDWMQRVLAQRGYAERLAVIQGSTPTEDREYIRAQFTADPAKRAGAGAARHRRRRRGHRPADALPPAGQLRHPVQPVPAGAADRPDRPLRPDRDTRDLPLRPRQHVVDLRRRRRLHGAGSPRKVAQVEQDLGSVNQVIGEEIQEHFARRKPAKRKAKGVDANEVINRRWPAASS